MLLLLRTVTLASVLLSRGVVCVPLVEHGQEMLQGWGQVVRLRHLYAARPGLHLLISVDGQVHGAADQSPYSLLEIRPVAPGSVVIRGVATDRFLCTRRDATLYASPTFIGDDCTFREQILPDGYNIYTSDKHGVLVSLGNPRQRLKGRDRGAPALAQFLPRMNSLEVPPPPRLHLLDPSSTNQTEEPLDDMDSFGKLSQIIHSPSFQER